MQKNVLITGISKNLGLALCRKLSEEGYFIYGTYNTSQKEAVLIKKELENMEIIKVDFTDRKKTFEFLNRLKDIKFDAIINNAGLVMFEKFDEISYENWDQLVEVNMTAPFIICHYLRNNIKDGGTIVNIASTDGLVGSYASIVYSATKAALLNLTQSLANVFGKRNIRVNSVSPKWMGSGMESPASASVKENTPLGRVADYWEVADVVSYLISSKATYINGANIIVDGGYSNVDLSLKKEYELLS